jgi:protein TonB
MLNTKFDLYNAEWLDVVFDDRNKAYGAYDLRSHYAGTLNKAMAIAFTVVVAAAIGLSFAFTRHSTEIIAKEVIVELPPLPPPSKTEKPKPEHQKPAAPQKPQPQVNTIQHLPPVVVPENEAVKEPVKNVDLQNAAIGSQTVKGVDPGEGVNIPEPTEGGGGGGTAPKSNGNEIVDFSGVEVSPEPFGGMAAFGKFLGKALRFPSQALDAGVSGRVLMSFVVEKNGEISNITVDRGAGYGFDQEAVRVLKLAKAWKPGMQNGQPVRVRYSIPINFQLPVE